VRRAALVGRVALGARRASTVGAAARAVVL
jgi:hypothetical protein